MGWETSLSIGMVALSFFYLFFLNLFRNEAVRAGLFFASLYSFLLTINFGLQVSIDNGSSVGIQNVFILAHEVLVYVIIAFVAYYTLSVLFSSFNLWYQRRRK